MIFEAIIISLVPLVVLHILGCIFREPLYMFAAGVISLAISSFCAVIETSYGIYATPQLSWLFIGLACMFFAQALYFFYSPVGEKREHWLR